MMFRPETVTGLDIGSSFIKLVQFRGKSDRLELVNLAVGKISPGASEEEVVEVLRRIIEEGQIKISTLITSIPRHMAVVRLVNLPSNDERELREMVRFEAERQMPFPLSQMEMDFQIISTQGGASKVLIVAVQKRDIQSHLSLLHQLGLSVEAIQLSSFAIFNCLKFNGEIEEKKVTALLYLGARTMEIDVFRDGSFHFSQSVTGGMSGYSKALQKELGISAEAAEQLKTEAGIPEMGGGEKEKKMARAFEIWLKHILSQVRRSFRIYRAQPDGTEVEELILSGGGANLKNLDSILQERLGLNVRLIDPLRKVRVKSLRFNLPELAPQLPLAVGLALGGKVSGGMEISLLPESVTELEVKKKRSRVRLVSIVLAGMVILGIVGLFIGTFNAKFRGLRDLRDRIKSSKPMVEKVDRMKEQLGILTSYADRSRSCLEILRALSIASPPDLYLTRFSFQRNRSVDLTGRADSESAVYWFHSALQKCGYFDKVDTSSPITKETGGVSFGLNCIIKGEM